MARSGARAAVMQLIYENLLGGDGDDTLEGLIAFEPEEDDREYIDRVFSGVEGQAKKLDAIIAEHSPTREIGRIARVVLSILRLALYEMLYEKDTPDSVAINEAVELAKRFGEPADARFINGVLGAVSRERGESAKV